MTGDRIPGFALLEAVVALAIVGMATVGAVGAIGGQVRAADRAIAALEAEALAEDRLGRMRLLGLDELEHLPDSMARGDFGPSWPGYEWTASAEPDRAQRRIMRVRVAVSGLLGRQVLETRLYRPPVAIRRTREGQ